MGTIKCREVEARLVDLAGKGGTIKSIARSAGVNLNSLHRWLREDEDFARRFYMPLESTRAEARHKIIVQALLGDLKAARVVLGWPELEDPPKDPNAESQGLMEGVWQPEEPDEYWDLYQLKINGGEFTEDQQQRFEVLSEGDPNKWEFYITEYRGLEERLHDLDADQRLRFMELHRMMPLEVRRSKAATMF